MASRRKRAERELPPVELPDGMEQPPLPDMPEVEPVRAGGHVLTDHGWVIEEK